MSARPARRQVSLHGPLLAAPPPRAARVRCRLCLLQGAREPASPPPDARLVSLRRTRNLVDGRSATEEDALGLLPPYVADRTTATSVSEVTSHDRACPPSEREGCPAATEVAQQRRTAMFRTDEQQSPQPGSPHGRLERGPLEDRHLRLACARAARVRRRRPGRHEAGRSDQGRPRRVGPHGQDPRCRVQGARE